jgi:hypothetical protein
MLKRTAVLGSLICLFALVGAAAQDAPVRLDLVLNEAAPESPDIRLVTLKEGYLLLLHVSGGNARVMFPGKPMASPALAGGEYNLDRLGADLPAAYGRGGIIVAAWSDTPIRTREFVRYGHWAISELNRSAFLADPTAATIALARRLGATPEAATVAYGSVADALYQEDVASHRFRTGPGDDLDWKVYQNLVRIMGRCPSGTRDITGAREFCSRPATISSRPSLSPITTMTRPEPANSPSRPQYSPPPAATRPPAQPPRASTPPASSGTRTPL